MIRPAALLLALAFTVPTIWDALVRQTVDIQTMLVHYLVAVPVAAILLGLVQLAAKPASVEDKSEDSRSANEAPAAVE
jgi:hypothetical protein